MKRILILLLICSIGIFSCEDEAQKVKVEKVVTASKTLTYNINTTGTINSTSSLSTDDIVNTLTDDIGKKLGIKDYTIKSLSISGITATIRKTSTNTASSFSLESFVTKSGGSSSVTLINAHNESIDDVLAPKALVVYLALGGVEEINTALADAIKKSGGKPVLNIAIKGNPSPANTRVAVTLILNIKFNMEYYYCEEVLSFVINPFDECLLQ